MDRSRPAGPRRDAEVVAGERSPLRKGLAQVLFHMTASFRYASHAAANSASVSLSDRATFPSPSMSDTQSSTACTLPDGNVGYEIF